MPAHRIRNDTRRVIWILHEMAECLAKNTSLVCEIQTKGQVCSGVDARSPFNGELSAVPSTRDEWLIRNTIKILNKRIKAYALEDLVQVANLHQRGHTKIENTNKQLNCHIESDVRD